MAAKLQKIEDVENPVVGRYYLVKCVSNEPKDSAIKGMNKPGCTPPGYSPGSIYEKLKPTFYPVLGAPHDDLDLDFPHRHYHFDWRFMKDSDIERVVNWGYSRGYNSLTTNSLKAGETGFSPQGKVFHLSYVKHHEPVYRRRKLVRKMSFFPNSEDFKSRNSWELKYLGKPLTKGHICPHKGVSLKGATVDSFGNTICPLHGLAFKHGVCVLRPSLKEEELLLQTEYNQMT